MLTRIILSSALRRKRIERGFTQAQLAELSDVGARTIGDLESKRGNPTLETLESIANALDIQVVELFDPEKADPYVYAFVKQELEKAQQENPVDES